MSTNSAMEIVPRCVNCGTSFTASPDIDNMLIWVTARIKHTIARDGKERSSSVWVWFYCHLYNMPAVY